MSIELSQHFREKKSIVNDILPLGFDFEYIMYNKYRTLIYNNFLRKNNFIRTFLFFFDGAPLWCFGPMMAVSISDMFFN